MKRMVPPLRRFRNLTLRLNPALFLFLFFWTNGFASCTKEDNPMPEESTLEPEAILPPGGLPAWSLQMELVAGHPENEALMVEARVSPQAWILVFPVNGILPGMQLRLSGRKRTLVDPASSRFVPLRGSRVDLLGTALDGPASLTVSRMEFGVQLDYSLIQKDGFSSRLGLTLVQAESSWPKTRELIPMIQLVAKVRIPPEILEMPISGWQWKLHSAGKTGYAGYRILQARSTFLLKDDLLHEPPRYQVARLQDVLPRLEAESSAKGPWVQSHHRPGLLYVNRKPHAVLGTSRPVFLGEIPAARVMLVPLAGGLLIAEHTVRGQDVWTFSR